MDKIVRGDVIWADLGEHPGLHLQSGRRPCVVISADKANQSSHTYNVLPGTTKQKEDDFPVHQKLMPREISGYLGKPTIFLAEQICTIDKKQVLCKVGHVDKKSEAISKINQIIARQLDLKEL